ncbi:MAG: hypothetical protein LC620_02840, partial [Halobacteriales archaeon]|nr:hypothetical protein [Halobacteriales archaeon]
MRDLYRPLAGALLAALLLSGCSTGPAVPSTTAPPTVLVTRPGDFSGDANATGANAPHLHDYWLGAERLVVMDGWPTEPGPGLAGGSQVPIYHYRPESGHVVPQGAARVEVTFAWTAASDDVYQDPELWVRTAGENESHFVGAVASGQTVAVNTTNAQDDLPHQLLSSWVFEFRLSQRSDLQILRFKANVTVHVEAVRGLPIPLYPGHPDRWDHRDQVTLVDVTRQVAYLQDPGDDGCDGVSCPTVESPRNGTIVPPDAAAVTATLTVTYGSPTKVGLAYHGAEGRDFQRLAPSREEGNTRTYT